MNNQWDEPDERPQEVCPLGLICEQMGERDSGYCHNFSNCEGWVEPWGIPYRYDFKQKALVVQLEHFEFSYEPEWFIRLLDDGWREAVSIEDYKNNPDIPF